MTQTSLDGGSIIFDGKRQLFGGGASLNYEFQITNSTVSFFQLNFAAKSNMSNIFSTQLENKKSKNQKPFLKKRFVFQLNQKTRNFVP